MGTSAWAWLFFSKVRSSRSIKLYIPENQLWQLVVIVPRDHYAVADLGLSKGGFTVWPHPLLVNHSPFQKGPTHFIWECWWGGSSRTTHNISYHCNNIIHNGGKKHDYLGTNTFSLAHFLYAEKNLEISIRLVQNLPVCSYSVQAFRTPSSMIIFMHALVPHALLWQVFWRPIFQRREKVSSVHLAQ
jgi:hypothetical protein